MPTPEALQVLGCPDPVRAFADAHRRHQLLALPTSGTSARPRTVVRTTDSWVDSFDHVSELLGITASSRVWVPGPATATMNLFAATHADWVGARRVDDPVEASHAHLTPATLRRVMTDRPSALAGVQVVTAGDRLESATYDDATAAGIRVSHYYGAAELSFVAWGEQADRLRPFPGVEVVTRDGELWVRSPYVCQGYAEPDQQLRRDAEGWVSVGDRGDTVDGRVNVRGREGGITTSGATVLVADIEPVLRAESTGDVVVIGLPHPDLGQVVAAVVTRRDDVPHLQEASRRLLDVAQRPRRWIHLEALPLTHAGKVDRVAVAAAAAAVMGSGDRG
ncbi:AMP-binding enzyme [Nocardioides jensenii]|uniref:AMP-binding enzyme n=1 Tax=Nocardioides jensenii TaxID=1843 RepID=UPI0008301ED3|nr:AMP-binding protein [Nocardioides jensenii]